MTYKIKRECWNSKTFNGYIDNPYWRIDINGNGYGLTDDGVLWSINDYKITEHIKTEVKRVINECRLNISLN